MVKFQITNENELFHYLIRRFPNKSSINLDNSFLPIKINSDVFPIYTTKNDSFWFMKIPIPNGVYYCFGLKDKEIDNEDIFARLIFKISSNALSGIKFFKSGKIVLEIRIKDNDQRIISFLDNNFKLGRSKKDKKRFFIYLYDKNNKEIIQNIKKLINLVEFDLDLNNNFLIVKDILNDKEYSGLKINKKPKKNIKSKRKSKTVKKFPIKNSPSKNNQLSDGIKNIFSKINNAIDEGYKYIILETGYGKSAIAAALINKYGRAFVLTEKEDTKNKYIDDFRWNGKDYQIHVSDYFNMLNDLDNYSKRKLLIMDDAHRIEESFVNYFSYSINLSNYEEDIINNFDYKIKDLHDKNYKVWFEFIDYLGLNTELNDIKEYIKENPENWICSYEDNEYRNELLFQPLNISDYTDKLFKKGDICIFMSQTIINLEEFVKELGLDISKVKFIHKEFEFCNAKNKIHIRNSVDMRFDSNSRLLIPIIKEILERHKNEKGLIHTYSSKYERFILKNIKDKRFISHKKFNKENKIIEFKNSKNSVLLSNSLNEAIDLKDSGCKFQIIIKQPLYQWGDRSKKKDSLQSDWYDYKKTVNLIQILLTPIKSKNDFCTHYILDENILKSFNQDIIGKKFIPECFVNSIVDMDMENCGLISDNIKKQFGVYYLFDYITSKRDKNKDLRFNSLSQEILNYKTYNPEKSDRYEKEFNYFTEELMKVISELSNTVINDNINKLALVCVPSSTTDRDKSASIRESINCIENWYNSEIAKSKFKCEKEIINCSNLLIRFSNVNTAHLSERRPSYIEHINSIKCDENEILNMDDVAFIILDDITTRGTIMNACEDILIKNGVNKKNIYKFALFKTLW